MPGTYNDQFESTDRSSCKPCVVGKYSNKSAMQKESGCQECEDGTYSKEVQRAVHFSDRGGLTPHLCKKCPSDKELSYNNGRSCKKEGKKVLLFGLQKDSSCQKLGSNWKTIKALSNCVDAIKEISEIFSPIDNFMNIKPSGITESKIVPHGCSVKLSKNAPSTPYFNSETGEKESCSYDGAVGSVCMCVFSCPPGKFYNEGLDYGSDSSDIYDIT